MKIGFLAYSLYGLEQYWEQLRDHADCWWGVTQEDTFEALQKRSMTQVVYCPDRLDYVPDRPGNKFVSLDPGRAERELNRNLSPDLWITDQTNRLTCTDKTALWVQTFHGLCFKKHTFHALTQLYDLLLLPGPYHRREFVKRLDFTQNDERLEVIGWPRVDKLCRGGFDRVRILEDLGLDPKRKTVLYAPTWGGYSKDLSSWGQTLFARWEGRELEIFEALCSQARDAGFNLVIKLHHLSIWAGDDRLKKIADGYGVPWVTPRISNFQVDPLPFLSVSDVLISDMSGIILDFMVLDRPIVFIEPDESIEAWKECSIPADYRAGDIVTTPEQLLEAIVRALDEPNRHSARRRRILSDIYSALDGRAAARGAEAILRLAAKHGVK